MLISLPYHLVFGGLLISSILLLGEAKVYYVKPSAETDCPGKPCHTLDYYHEHKGWINRREKNITLKFLSGIYDIKPEPDYLPHSDASHLKWIGLKPACEVIFLLHKVSIMSKFDVSDIHLENLTFVSNSSIFATHIQFPCSNTSLVGMVFSRVHLSFPQCAQSTTLMLNSNFTNWTSIDYSYYKANPFATETGIQWNVTGCNLDNVLVAIGYIVDLIAIDSSNFTNIQSCNAFIKEIIEIHNSTIVITGNTMFDGWQCNPLSVLTATSSNITIRGHVTFSNFQQAITTQDSNIHITGEVVFANHRQTAIVLYSSVITLSGKNISFINNSGTKGGAMYLYYSTLNIDKSSHIDFYNNSAEETGGALHVEFDPDKHLVYCFYQLLQYSNLSRYAIHFENNTAIMGGDHIYGEYMHSEVCNAAVTECEVISSYDVQQYFTYIPDIDSSFSAVSSAPMRVCFCHHNHQPHCKDDQIKKVKVYPGEQFTLHVVVVGADFGTTVGTVHAILASSAKLKTANQRAQSILNHRECSELRYNIFSSSKHETIYLTVKDASLETVEENYFGETHPYYNSVMESLVNQSEDSASGEIDFSLLTKLLLVNVTLLHPCPPGFILLGDPPGCECHPKLNESGISCHIRNRTGYISWEGPMWVNASEIFNSNNSNETWHDILSIADYCPFDLCKVDYQKFNVNLRDDPDAQCAYNHVGRLCGGCRENHSLAIGSSQCIPCYSDNNLALLIFFAAAGILLVFFINVMNLTVTQGSINGLIFYANIIWAYQGILFPEQVGSFVLFLKTFIAWLNLDFGIQSCFVDGLNAFWKTWLQYAFPLYVWMIAGIVILWAKYSTIVAKIFGGNRAVPMLATLFLLSYMKLLRTIIISVRFTRLNVFSEMENATLIIWSLDGRYDYCHFPHILLFIAAIATLLFLWIPYTLLLLLVMWLRKISHMKFLRWIPRLNPVYDAYFAPLKDKHHYWFGVLLLVRGVLLLTFTLTCSIQPDVNLLVLLITAALLLCYANYKRVYRNKVVQLLENFFLLMLITVGGTSLLNLNDKDKTMKYIIVYVSIGAGFVVFCGLIIWSILAQTVCKNPLQNRPYHHNDQRQIQREQADAHVQVSSNAQLRDSVLEETQPLLNNTSTY